MSTWFRDGVHLNLIPEAAEDFRQIKKLYAVGGEDLFVTSGNDGSHTIGSFHYTDKAFDFRKGKFKTKEIKAAIKGQIVDETDHYHYEYDVN